MTTETTVAKMGRSMKKCENEDMPTSPYCLGWLPAAGTVGAAVELPPPRCSVRLAAGDSPASGWP